LTCTKEGYTSWTKEIEVHSGVSTEFWNIILFPIDSRQVKSFDSISVDQYFISPREENEIIYFWQDEDKRYVSLLNVDSGESENVFETSEFDFIDADQQENIEWSSDNKRILIPFQKEGEKIYIIARIRKENLEDVINLNALFTQAMHEEFDIEKTATETKQLASKTSNGISFKKVRWMFDKNDELVLLTKDKTLHYFDITRPDKTLVIDKNVSGFDFAGNRIYYSQLPNNIIWEIKNNDTETKRQITNVPIPESEDDFLRLTAYDQYRIAIETEDKKLYVHNEEKEKGETSMYDLGTSIKGVQFSDDGKKIAYWTSNEMWCLMLREWKVQPIREKGTRIFVTRFSQPIYNIQWMDNYENLLFSIGSSIKSAYIDTRWGVHITDVYSQDDDFENRSVIYNKADQNLYFASNNQENKKILNMMTLIDKGFFDF
jgi:hypothetical protein